MCRTRRQLVLAQDNGVSLSTSRDAEADGGTTQANESGSGSGGSVGGTDQVHAMSTAGVPVQRPPILHSLPANSVDIDLAPDVNISPSGSPTHTPMATTTSASLGLNSPSSRGNSMPILGTANTGISTGVLNHLPSPK